MKEIACSEFKAKCLGFLEQVRKTKRPIVITRFGEPIATLGPAPAPPKRTDFLGCLAGTGRIIGDIVSPAVDAQDWEAFR